MSSSTAKEWRSSVYLTWVLTDSHWGKLLHTAVINLELVWCFWYTQLVHLRIRQWQIAIYYTLFMDWSFTCSLSFGFSWGKTDGESFITDAINDVESSLNGMFFRNRGLLRNCRISFITFLYVRFQNSSKKVYFDLFFSNFYDNFL